MKTQIKVEHVTTGPNPAKSGKLIQSNGIKDETNAREWGERQGVDLVYFSARKQRVWAFKPNGAKQAELAADPGPDPDPRAPSQAEIEEQYQAAGIDPIVIPEEKVMEILQDHDGTPVSVSDFHIEELARKDPDSPLVAPVREWIRLDHILPNAQQPRSSEDPETVKSVAQSIADVGLKQVPAARPIEGKPGFYELVFGHTRLAAFRMLASGGIPGADPERFQTMPLDVAARNDLSMFVEAVVENVERQDLTVIDLAKVAKRAIEVYGMTSAEAGTLINKDASTVRNLIRFLELPREAQEKLARSEITQNDARALLSVQKVATPKQVQAVVARIEKQAGREHPDEVIDAALGDLQDDDRVIQMWDGERADGNPRGIRWQRWAWELNTTKFPNDKLPAIVQENLFETIGKEKAALVLELVGRTHDAAEFDISLNALDALTDDDRAKIRNLVNPPACTACAFYTKIRGSHYCGLKVCHERKVEAWKADIIAKASIRLKILPYSKSDGAFFILDGWDHKAIFERRDPNLRLVATDREFRKYQSYDGVETDVFMVAIVGAGMEKIKKGTVQKAEGGSQYTPAARLEQKKNRVFRARFRYLVWEFAGAGRHMFAALNLEALKELNNWKGFNQGAEPPQEIKKAGEGSKGEARLEYERQVLVYRMYNERHNMAYMHRQSLDALANSLEKYATLWGFKLPARVRQLAAEGDAEINAIKLAPPAKASKPAARKITPAPKPTPKVSKK